MKILIPVDDENQGTSKPSAHFGHCLGFYLCDSENSDLEFIKNDFPHSDPKKAFVDYIMDLKPNAVFSLGMGQKAIDLFNNYQIDLLTGEFENIAEILKNIDKLKPLSKNCGH